MSIPQGPGGVPWTRPPATPPPPPSRPGRLVLAVVAGGLAAVTVLSLLVWRVGVPLAAEVQSWITPYAAPPSQDMGAAVEAADLACVQELRTPEVHSCYTLVPDPWGWVQWYVEDDAVLGVYLETDHDSRSLARTTELYAAVGSALGLAEDEVEQLASDVDRLAEEAGEHYVGTEWGDFTVSSDGDGYVYLEGEAWDGWYDDPRTEPTTWVSLELGAAAVALGEQGLDCERVREDHWSTLDCESAAGDHLSLSADEDHVTGLTAAPWSQTGDVVRGLLTSAPAEEQDGLLAAIEAAAGEPSGVVVRGGWVVVLDDDWLVVRAAGW